MSHEIAVLYRWMLDTLTIAYTLFHRTTPDNEDGVARAVHLVALEIVTRVRADRPASAALTDADLERLFQLVVVKVAELAGLSASMFASLPPGSA